MMIGIDANVLVRYFTHDDPIQTKKARTLLHSFTEKDPGFVSLVVVIELFWVLRFVYGYDVELVSETLTALLDTEELIVEEADEIRQALTHIVKGHDLGDVLIAQAGRDTGCTHTATFDKRAAKLPEMKLLR